MGWLASGIHAFLTGEKRLRMAWEVRKSGKLSLLVGTAHFFPYHFRGSLRRHLDCFRTVVMEGPLDEQARRRVVAAGTARGSDVVLEALLRPDTVIRLNAELKVPTPTLGMHPLSQEVFNLRPADFLGVEIGRMKPWMAFFRIWDRYLSQHGWTHRIELDVLRASAALGKPVQFLETIEEQIAALEGIPVARILDFLDRVDWAAYRRNYARSYLKGALEPLIDTTRVFPSNCESVLGRRDPVLNQRMRPHFEAGDTVVFLGVLHCPRILELLCADGYEVLPLGRS